MSNKKSIILLNKIEGKVLEAQKILSGESELEFLNLDLNDSTTFFSPQLCPCLLICMDMKVSIDFLKRYKNTLRESSSKFCFISSSEISRKDENYLLVLGAGEVLVDAKTNVKALAHKITLYAKALPDLDEKAKDMLKIKHLNVEKRISQSVEARAQINFETIDFFILEKFCTKCLRILTELEFILDEYEETPSKHTHQVILDHFEDMRQNAYHIELHHIADFLEVTKHILKREGEIEEPTFKSVLVGILFNLVDFMRTEITGIKNKKNRRQILDNPHKGLFNRLYWLDEKFVKSLNDNTISVELDKLGISRC